MVRPFYYRGRLWCYLSNTGHWPRNDDMAERKPKILYVNGCFTDTTVGQSHYSKFCGLFSATPLKHCPSGNWAD